MRFHEWTLSKNHSQIYGAFVAPKVPPTVHPSSSRFNATPLATTDLSITGPASGLIKKDREGQRAAFRPYSIMMPIFHNHAHIPQSFSHFPRSCTPVNSLCTDQITKTQAANHPSAHVDAFEDGFARAKKKHATWTAAEARADWEVSEGRGGGLMGEITGAIRQTSTT